MGMLKYEAQLLDYTGKHIETFDSRSLDSLEYERKFNDIGSFSMAMSGSQARWIRDYMSLPTGLDYFIKIYRLNSFTGIREVEGTFFVRLVNPYYTANGTLFTIVGGHSLEHLLLRRLIVPSIDGVKYDPLAAKGFVTDAGQVSTVISRLARAHLGDMAIDERRIPNFHVIDQKSGDDEGGRWRFDGLFETVNKLANAGDVQFKIELLEGNNIVMSVGRLFKDLTTRENYLRGKFTRLNRRLGTLVNPSILMDYQQIGNVVFIRGGGNESNELVITQRAERLDISPYNRIEFSSSASRDDGTSPTLLLTEAKSSLREMRPKVQLTFPMTDVPGAQYKTDFDLGDIVSVEAGGFNREVRISSVQVSIDEGTEQVSIETEVDENTI